MEFITFREKQKLIQCQKAFFTSSMSNLLNNIETAVHSPGMILKNDPTSTVVVVHIDAKPIVIKRANIKNTYHRCRRFFLPTRARKNWYNATQLLHLGINTITPIAFVEERYGPLNGRSYFLSSYIEGQSALLYFQDESKRPFWPLAIQNLINLTSQLANNWVSHRDLNLSNIIFKDEKPWLIDLDGMCKHTFFWFAKRAAKRERERFLQNCLETPGVSAEIRQLLAQALAQVMLNSSS
jgi:hypothetical protein